MRKLQISVLTLLLSMGCAKAPASLSPQGAAVFKANEAVVALGTLQHAAIELNALKTCDVQKVCTPVLSDANTRVVVDSVEAALKTIRAVPDGWKATAGTALQQIQLKLDQSGRLKISAYVTAARTVLDAL